MPVAAQLIISRAGSGYTGRVGFFPVDGACIVIIIDQVTQLRTASLKLYLYHNAFGRIAAIVACCFGGTDKPALFLHINSEYLFDRRHFYIGYGSHRRIVFNRTAKCFVIVLPDQPGRKYMVLDNTRVGKDNGIGCTNTLITEISRYAAPDNAKLGYGRHIKAGKRDDAGCGIHKRVAVVRHRETYTWIVEAGITNTYANASSKIFKGLEQSRSTGRKHIGIVTATGIDGADDNRRALYLRM